MNKNLANIIMILSVAIFLAVNPLAAFAQTDSQVIIRQLQEQIKSLQAQISSLTMQLSAVREELNFTRTLRRGLVGDDVKHLQAFLKKYPDIYPEGLVTGYYGPLTEQAVKRLQEKQGIVSVGSFDTTGFGQVGPETITKLRELSISQASTTAPIPTLISTPTLAPAPVSTSTQGSTSTSAVTTPAVGTGTVSSGGGSGGGAVSSTPTSSASSSVTTTTVTNTTNTSGDTTPPSAPTNFSAIAVPSYPYSYGSVKLSWLGSTDNTGVSGYKVYRGGNVIAEIGVVPSLSQNERSFTSGEGYLQFTTTYGYYVVAYDAAGNVSTPSASASATTLSADTPHDTTPPVISNIQVSNITETSATISWTTDENSEGFVNYGPSYVEETGHATSHQVTISGLTSFNTYHFIIASIDTSGNQAKSSAQTFTTSSPTTSSLLPQTTLTQMANILEAMRRILNQIQELLKK